MTLPKLLLVGYFHLLDGFQTCANFLQNYYQIIFFPLSKFVQDNYDIVAEFNKVITEHDIDVVLLWNLSYFYSHWKPCKQLFTIKQRCFSKVKFIGYNWDPLLGDLTPLRLAVIKLLYKYYTGDGLEIKLLTQSPINLNNIIYAPSGFDPLISYCQPHPSNEHFTSPYQCQVSIICTNLYDDTKQFPLNNVRLNRKHLVDAIYSDETINFHIYGPEFLRKLYPRAYKGSISYQDCPKVFSNSMINLCIHAVSYHNYNDYLYFSERLPQILGCKSLLYCETDYQNTWIKPDVHYILADTENPVQQIKHLINTYYDDYVQSIINNGYQLAKTTLTWDNMAKIIYNTTSSS